MFLSFWNRDRDTPTDILAHSEEKVLLKHKGKGVDRETEGLTKEDHGGGGWEREDRS